MLQALELSDAAPCIPDEIGEVGPCALTGYDEAAPNLVSRVMGWSFAAGMILLAPLFIVSLAAAFVVACLRLQQGELGNESSSPRPATSAPPARRGLVAVANHRQPVYRGNPVSALADAHLWN
jgi:hypothetical protein